jgi:hypothetical protein
VPDFLAAGPRDIFVAASGADNARDILGAQEGYERPPRAPLPRWVRALAVIMVAVTVALVAAGVVIALVA